MTPEEFNAQLNAENFKRALKLNAMGHDEIAQRINAAFPNDEAARTQCWELSLGYKTPQGKSEASLIAMSAMLFGVIDEVIAEEK